MILTGSLIVECAEDLIAFSSVNLINWLYRHHLKEFFELNEGSEHVNLSQSNIEFSRLLSNSKLIYDGFNICFIQLLPSIKISPFLFLSKRSKTYLICMT